MNRPLRFCMITTFYPPYHFGGDAMHIYRVSNALARRGHTVDVICDQDAYHLLHPGPPSGDFPNEPGVTLHALKTGFGFLSALATQQTGRPFFKARKIRAIMKEHPPDVIHFNNISLVGGPGVLFLGDAVKLYTTHEHWLVCPMHVLWKYGREACDKQECFRCQIAGRRPPQLWRHTGLMKRALKQVDMFLSPSQFTLTRHTEWGGLDIPIRQLPYYYHPPVEAGGKAGDGRDAAEKSPEPLGLPHPRPYFLIVGRLEKIKGIQNVLPIFRKYSDADLLIAGEGEYGETLREMGEGIEGVRFLGRMSQAELTRLYAGAIASIVPSICYEVFGIIILESFAQKTPVIAHHFGVLPEVIEQGGGGMTYRDERELIDAMRTIQTDPDRRRELGERGYESYLKYWSEDAHLDQYLGIVDELLEVRRSKA